MIRFQVYSTANVLLTTIEESGGLSETCIHQILRDIGVYGVSVDRASKCALSYFPAHCIGVVKVSWDEGDVVAEEMGDALDDTWWSDSEVATSPDCPDGCCEHESCRRKEKE